MIKNPYPGKFIVFEGLDGSGQSTQVKLLGEFFKKHGYQTTLTKEPTLESGAGRKIKEILDEKVKIEPAELQKLFSQDRRKHLEKVIIPALKKGQTVISDRYFFSSFAFGSVDLDLDWLVKINQNFPYPDIVFFLNVRPEICLKRIEKRGEKIKLFEKREKLEKVFKNYRLLAKKFENFLIIDGERSIKEVFDEVENIMLKKFL